MKDKILETLKERSNFRKVEEVPTDKHSWSVYVHAGADSKTYGSSYVVPIYSPLNAEHIIVQASANINSEHKDMLRNADDNEILEIQKEIGYITGGREILGVPEDSGGEESPIMYADSYTFYQYFFPEEFNPTLLLDKVTCAMTAVDQTWAILWSHTEENP